MLALALMFGELVVPGVGEEVEEVEGKMMERGRRRWKRITKRIAGRVRDVVRSVVFSG